jgi:ethanolamine ammonia-lyase small subunit
VSDLSERLRATTPARLVIGRTGGSYRTTTQLELRRDHAAAVDAVWRPLSPASDWGAEFLEQWRIFEVCSEAASKEDFLRRPDWGRRLSASARDRIVAECPARVDLQVVVGDGLSVAAVALQVPQLLPRLMQLASDRGWTVGRPFVVRHCRVGVMNDVGDLLSPRVVALLIGERPGLATAESLSVYLGYHPRTGHTDAQRNLISNIHDRGVSIDDAARRTVALITDMMSAQASGVGVKERIHSIARLEC